MTEAEACSLLRDYSLEAWISGRRWKAAPGGWTVTGELQGWQFRINVIPQVSRLAPARLVATLQGGSSPNDDQRPWSN